LYKRKKKKKKGEIGLEITVYLQMNPWDSYFKARE